MGDEDRSEQLDRELIELLNELRVVLPGVQVLFAFLLAVPFTQRWEQTTDIQRDAFLRGDHVRDNRHGAPDRAVVVPPAPLAGRRQGADAPHVQPAGHLGDDLPRALDDRRRLRRHRRRLRHRGRGLHLARDGRALRLVLVRAPAHAQGPRLARRGKLRESRLRSNRRTKSPRPCSNRTPGPYARK